MKSLSSRCPLARRASRPARQTADSSGRGAKPSIVIITGEKWRGVADENPKEEQSMTHTRVEIFYGPEAELPSFPRVAA